MFSANFFSNKQLSLFKFKTKVTSFKEAGRGVDNKRFGSRGKAPARRNDGPIFGFVNAAANDTLNIAQKSNVFQVSNFWALTAEISTSRNAVLNTP